MSEEQPDRDDVDQKSEVVGRLDRMHHELGRSDVPDDELAELAEPLERLRAEAESMVPQEDGEGPPPVNRYDRQVAWWNEHPRLLWVAVRAPLVLFAVAMVGSILQGWFDEALYVWTSAAALGVMATMVAFSTNVYSAHHSEGRHYQMTTSRRLALMASRIEGTRDDLDEALDEIEQLRELAAELEQEAEDNLELAQLTSAQADALRRERLRERRRDLWFGAALSFASGVAVTVLWNVFVG